MEQMCVSLGTGAWPLRPKYIMLLSELCSCCFSISETVLGLRELSLIDESGSSLAQRINETVTICL